MLEKITLRGGSRTEGLVEVELAVLQDSTKWPIRIWGGDKHYVSLSDDEARHLLEILQKRYPLDSLASL